MAIPLRDRYTTPTRRPRWRWWVGTIVILLLWLVGGSVLSLVILPWTGVDLEAFFVEADMFTSFPSWGFLLFALVSFIPLLVGTLVAYRLILGVKIRRLFAAGVRFRMWRVGWGALVWVLIMAGPALIAIVVSPEQFDTSSFNVQAFVPYAIIAVLLLPVQTTAEEVFFRGWLIQGLSQRYKQHLAAVHRQRHCVCPAPPGQPRSGRRLVAGDVRLRLGGFRPGVGDGSGPLVGNRDWRSRRQQPLRCARRGL